MSEAVLTHIPAIQIARVAHEVNRAYCRFLGDDSQPSWYDAPAWQRDSAIRGVISVTMNTNVTPEEQHQAWMNHKQAEGWTYGPIKDSEKKTHPCMVPFDQLPPDQQVKDILFIAIVKALCRDVLE